MDTLSDTEVTLSERAYRDLRQAIVRCEFEPGERLRVDELSKKYEVSSSPLREALSRLAEQGFVRVLDKRGFRVAELTASGISDLTRVRLLVECEALRDAMAHANDAWEASVVATAHSLGRIEQRLGEPPFALDNNWSERHRAFHLAIYSACSSPLLLEFVGALFDSAERYRRYSASHWVSSRSKHNEHEALLKCVLSGDADQAITKLRSHIQGTETRVMEALLAMRPQAPAGTTVPSSKT